MKINFLAAADNTPLTKTFTQHNHEILTSPYPFVRDFNSFEYQIHTPADFLAVLTEHGKLGHCLLKGELDRRLVNESRAGHTDPNKPTRWALFDIDVNTGLNSVAHLLRLMGLPVDTMTYIIQHSASSGVKGPIGLRCHVFVIFANDVLPTQLKLWLQYLNLTVPELRKLSTLSANGLSLKYALDITTCQSDKLIYTATPVFNGLEDPLKDKRFELIANAPDPIAFTPPFINPQQVQDLADERVAELRKDAGLKKQKTPKYCGQGPSAVLQNPDVAVVTGTKDARGFTYLNLNGGDSWGYFYHTANPELLYNFKGEPPVRLRDIVPDYYDAVVKASQAGSKLRPFVFRDKARDQYYNVLYDPATDAIDSLDIVASKDRMSDFMELHGETLPDPIEDWTIAFDPRTTKVLDQKNRYLNTFQPTPYLRTHHAPVPNPPLVITKILRHICGDEPTSIWVTNWLAVLFQYRIKIGTCPVFNGVQGTGKGIFFERVMAPLLGPKHCPKATTQQFKEQFNSFLEDAVLAAWDEAHMNADPILLDKIKHLVTEPHLMIRAMRQNAREVQSFVNLMIFTNHPDPIPLPANDRRFAICPAQHEPLRITEGEIDAIEDELPIFAAYLQHYPANTQLARTVPKNQAREAMIRASQTTVEEFFHNLRTGNLNHFLDFLRGKASLSTSGTYVEYEETMKRWASIANTGKGFVTRDECMAAYSYIIKPYHEPAKFSRLGRVHHTAFDQRSRVGGKLLRGRFVEFTSDNHELLAELREPKKPELNLVNA